MTTTVVKTIGSGGDYSTLQAWEDACPANLVTADQVWQGQIKNASDVFTITSGIGVNISGTTVDATRYVELTTAAGASFRDNANAQTNALRYDTANGCAITSSAGYASIIQMNQDFCRISNLQLTMTGAHTNGVLQNAGTTCDVNNCIIEMVGQAVEGVAIFGSGARIRNSLVVGRKASMSQIAKVASSAAAYNTTFAVASGVAAASAAIGGNYGTTPLTNCLFYNVTAVATGGATRSYTTCKTSVAGNPIGAGSTVSYSNSNFVEIADGTRDFRIPSGSAFIDVGTTDSTNAANDIVGTARPQGSAYDIGAWEYKAAVAADVVPLYQQFGGGNVGPHSYGLKP